jgi:molecular chaperone GrpE (heat shock protein)
MTNRPPPTLAKWPFIVSDLLLLLFFVWLIRYVLPSGPKSATEYVFLIFATLAWMFGAWVCILPWVKEFQAQSKYAESEALTSAIEQIQRLEEVGARVQSATATWQAAHDAAARVTNVAKEIEERIKADSKDFMEFAERINKEEQQHLRLEVEKLRRSEAEWLQVAARILDHTFALTAAALRSGQPNLAAQMTNFQNACRDAARRVGLVAFHPAIGDPFDDRSQQLEDQNAKPEEGSVVSEILATGYTFQGQLLRKALVRLSNAASAPQVSEPVAEAAAAPQPQIHEPDQFAVAEQAEEIREERIEPETQAVDSPQPIEDFVVESYRPSPEPSDESGQNSTDSILPPPETEEAAAAEYQERHVEIASETNTEHLSADASVEEQINEPIVGEHPIENSPEEHLVEVASSEMLNEESVIEEKARRRQRKPDPQTSLPF